MEALNERVSQGPGRARVSLKGGALTCAEHGKLLARVSPRGVELWCKCSGGHPAVITWDELASIKRA